MSNPASPRTLRFVDATTGEPRQLAAAFITKAEMRHVEGFNRPMLVLTYAPTGKDPVEIVALDTAMTFVEQLMFVQPGADGIQAFAPTVEQGLLLRALSIMAFGYGWTDAHINAAWELAKQQTQRVRAQNLDQDQVVAGLADRARALAQRAEGMAGMPRRLGLE